MQSYVCIFIDKSYFTNEASNCRNRQVVADKRGKHTLARLHKRSNSTLASYQLSCTKDATDRGRSWHKRQKRAKATVAFANAKQVGSSPTLYGR